jgi:hypothetical protein
MTGKMDTIHEIQKENLLETEMSFHNRGQITPWHEDSNPNIPHARAVLGGATDIDNGV